MTAPPTLMQVLVLVTMVLLTGAISRQRQVAIIAIVQFAVEAAGFLIACALVLAVALGLWIVPLWWILASLVGAFT